MGKEYLISYIHVRAGLASRRDAEKIFMAAMESMNETLAKGEKVSLRGFGTLEVLERKARRVLNPRTGDPMTIPAHRAVKFLPGRRLSALAQKAEAGGEEWQRGKAFVKSASRLVTEWKNSVEVYGRKAEKLGEEAGVYFKERVSKLGNRVEEARYKFSLLRMGSDSAMDEVKKGFDSAMSELKTAFKRAMEKF